MSVNQYISKFPTLWWGMTALKISGRWFGFIMPCHIDQKFVIICWQSFPIGIYKALHDEGHEALSRGEHEDHEKVGLLLFLVQCFLGIVQSQMQNLWNFGGLNWTLQVTSSHQQEVTFTYQHVHLVQYCCEAFLKHASNEFAVLTKQMGWHIPWPYPTCVKPSLQGLSSGRPAGRYQQN